MRVEGNEIEEVARSQIIQSLVRSRKDFDAIQNMMGNHWKVESWMWHDLTYNFKRSHWLPGGEWIVMGKNENMEST